MLRPRHSHPMMKSLLFSTLFQVLLINCSAKNYPLELHSSMTPEQVRSAYFVREQRVLFDDPLYPHPDRLAGRSLQIHTPNAEVGPGTPGVVAPYGASMLGGVGKTTVAGTDPYSGLTFPVGSTIAGPFEAGFDSQIDTLLSWLGCSPASRGYLAGGIDTATGLAAVNYQCGASLPVVSGGIFKSLMWSMGVHSPPDNAGCTSPPSGISGQCTASNPAYHFHQNFTQLYSLYASGHSTKIGVTTPSTTSFAASNIYGMFEDTNILPSLDACNAHWGVTPDSGGASIYHHHVTDAPPFAVGCYGPPSSGGLTSLATCRSYYAGCDNVTLSVTTATKGNFLYDNWCPCYDAASGSNLVQYLPASPTPSLSPSKSVSPSVSPSATAVAPVRLSITVVVPAAAVSKVNDTGVLSQLKVDVAALLAVVPAWVSVSATQQSRRRALQTTTMVTWYAIIAPTASASSLASLSSLASAISTATAASLTTALANTFSVLANTSGVSGTSSFSASAISCSSNCPSAAASPSSPDASTLSGGAIAGIVIGSIVAAILIAIGAAFLCCSAATTAIFCFCCKSGTVGSRQGGVTSPPPGTFAVNHPAKVAS